MEKNKNMPSFKIGDRVTALFWNKWGVEKGRDYIVKDYRLGMILPLYTTNWESEDLFIISPRPKIRNNMKDGDQTLRRIALSDHSRNIFGEMVDRLSEDRDLWEKLEARIGEILETREAPK